ncbi:MAG: polyprenyl synthetase family protein [Chitinophagales bacterium]|nr:polyprenyl synthetase family protein [Chitinophagales bacterium]
MPLSLEEIKKPVAEDLKRFEDKFKQAMKSKTPLLDRITHYIIKRKGKQIRPMFVFLSARMFGEIRESTYTAASLIELLHTATLVHDDVVDDAYQRRGMFSINALWKNKIAVLVGDYLLAKGLLLSVEKDAFGLLKIVSNAVKEMSEGELLQIEKARKLDIQEDIYFKIIRQKTATLMSSSCAAGAASTNNNKEEVERIRLMGEMIGIAFQIKDDLFDYGNGAIGKPKAIDIKERKMTLPIIYALNNVSKSEKRWMINVVKNHNTDQKKVGELIEKVKASGGIEYAKGRMDEYHNKAKELLLTFPESESRNSIMQLFNYVIERNK